MINVHILFHFKSSLLNMFLVKTFRARQRKCVSISLINVNMTPERFFADFYLDGLMQYCLLYNKNSDFSSKTRNSWEWSCSLCYYKHTASSSKFRRHIPDIHLRYRPDSLFGTITQLIEHLWKLKNTLNKIFDNLTFRMIFLCVRIKVFFIEYKYFGLNKNIYIFHSMQIFFIKRYILYWI